MKHGRGGCSLLFAPPPPAEGKNPVAHPAAVLAVDSFSGIVQRWKPAAQKSTMVLKFQMVRSGAVFLAWVNLPDNDVFAVTLQM